MLELIMMILRSMAGYTSDWTASSGRTYIYFKATNPEAKRIIVAVMRLCNPTKWSVECTGVHGWSFSNHVYPQPTYYRLTDTIERMTPCWNIWLDEKINLTIFFK